MDAFARQVRARVMRWLRETGDAPSAGNLATDLGASLQAVTDTLRALADARALVLAPGTGAIWMAHPFSAVETGHERGATGTPQAVYELGREWFAAFLDEDWRRPTAGEAEAIFARHGFTGEFWRLD